MHARQVDGSFGKETDSTSHPTPSFAEQFKKLRKQLVGKQACLSGAGLRCTDAAISHWERGLRLPRPRTMRNAVAVLTELGATPRDIEQLISAWTAECTARSVLARRRLSPQPPALAYAG
jgi:hypothetical protein